MPTAGEPRTMNGLRLSKLPTAASDTLPPLGASGFASGKWLKSSGSATEPSRDKP